MPTSWDVLKRSFFLKEVMSPKVYGSVGGPNKLHFMMNERALEEWSITRNNVLTEFLRGLHLVLGVRHMKPPSLRSFKSNLLKKFSRSDDENSDPKAKADNLKAKADDAQEDSMEFYFMTG